MMKFSAVRVTGFSLRFAGLDLLCQDNCKCMLPFLSGLTIWSVTTCTSTRAGAGHKGYQVTCKQRVSVNPRISLLTFVKTCHLFKLRSFPVAYQSNQPLLLFSKDSCCTGQAPLQWRAAELYPNFQIQRGQDSKSKTAAFVVLTQHSTIYPHLNKRLTYLLSLTYLTWPTCSGWEKVLIRYCLFSEIQCIAIGRISSLLRFHIYN